MGRKSLTSKKAAMRRCGLDRADWDFSNVERSEVPLVCMREYAKECLREINVKEDAISYGDHLIAALGAVPKLEIDPSLLVSNVIAGLGKRATTAGNYPPDRPALKQIDLLWMARTSAHPTVSTDVAGDFVMFNIDLRADTAAIKKAFSQWLRERERTFVNSIDWMHRSVLLTILSIGGHGELAPFDYTDAKTAIRTVWNQFFEYGRGSKVTAHKVISALRTLAGKKRGRGDSKKSLLTDLSIYRLHRAGHDLEDVASKLGKQRLKFVDSAVAKRAIERASTHIHRTLADAFACEYYVALFHKHREEYLLKAAAKNLNSNRV
jgi:hypothetical protein